MFTKEMQTKKNKDPKITQHDKDYLNWLQKQSFKCFICDSLNNIEMHHVKFKSTDKKNHKRLIPLCIDHHKGNDLSPHGTPKKWREQISIEMQNHFAEKIYREYRDSLL